MKISDFTDDSAYLKITDFENFFRIGVDKRGNYFYNLNETLYIDVEKEDLPEFTCDHNMHWSLISYKIYGTTRLTWLLWKVNDIQPSNVFDIIPAGTAVRYVDSDSVQTIVKNINDYEDY